MRRGPPAIRDLFTEDVVSRYPLIVAETGDPDDDPIRNVLRQRGLPYNVALEVGTFETLKHYVAQGHGLAAVSGMCLGDEDRRVLTAIQNPR